MAESREHYIFSSITSIYLSTSSVAESNPKTIIYFISFSPSLSLHDLCTPNDAPLFFLPFYVRSSER